MMLKLEYTCTEAEFAEAQFLNEYGGKPKWRIIAGNWGQYLAVAAMLLYYGIKTGKPEDRPFLISLVILVLVALFIKPHVLKWLAKEKKNEPVQVEVSEQGLVFAGDGRTTMAWSAFSQCRESPNLFVLVSRSQRSLYPLPKRAFPDAAAQNWFRTLANQPASALAAAGEKVPGQFATPGITLTVRMGFRDCLIRMVTSWRIKGIALGVLVLVTGVCLSAPEPPHPVNSRAQTLVIILAIVVPMLLALAPVVALIAWLSERKWRTPQHVALSSEGIEFVSGGASGVLPWSTYKYYLENRWTFFIWQPKGSQWFMMPKREFASTSDVDQCRELLRTKLKVSSWFYM